MLVLETKDLTKYYHQRRALHQFSIKVEQGQILGLLAPNGSGKSTALGLLLGVTKPTSGDIIWHQPKSHSLQIGALLETPCFYPYLNARHNLQLVATIRNLSNPKEAITKALELAGLDENPKLRYANFSSGMKQRLGFASAFLGSPDVIILDEPNNHLDAKGIVDIRHTITQLANQGKTVIIASHILSEVEKMCTHIIIMNKGQLCDQGSLADLLSRSKQDSLESYYLDLTKETP